MIVKRAFFLIVFSFVLCISLHAQGLHFQTPKYRFAYDTNGNQISSYYTFLICLTEPTDGSEEYMEELSTKEVDVFCHSDILSIVKQNGDETYNYTLYSLAGQLLRYGTTSDTRLDIHLSDYPYSVYILTISTATTKRSWKLVKTTNLQ